MWMFETTDYDSFNIKDVFIIPVCREGGEHRTATCLPDYTAGFPLWEILQSHHSQWTADGPRVCVS